MDAKTAIVKSTDAVAAAPAMQADTIYMMGVSFVLGAFFAIFILVMLDFMKRDRVSREPD